MPNFLLVDAIESFIEQRAIAKCFVVGKCGDGKFIDAALHKIVEAGEPSPTHVWRVDANADSHVVGNVTGEVKTTKAIAHIKWSAMVKDVETSAVVVVHACSKLNN